MTHTQAPWVVKKVHRGVGLRPALYVMAHASSSVETIAEVVNYGVGRRGEANARLIADAPETAAERDRLKAVNADLLAALEGIWTAWQNDRDPSDSVLLKAEAAIAKARDTPRNE